MKITPVSAGFLSFVASLPVFCDSREPSVSHLEASPGTRSLFAPSDDVHLSSNGLLQLGSTMREFVQKTKEQINTIFQKSNIFDRSFVQSSASAGEIKEGEEESKQTALALNTHNEEIKESSKKISSKMESISQEKSQLSNKVESMEEKVSRSSVESVTVRQVAEINSLKEVIQRQEQSINNSSEAMEEQGRHSDHQTTKIKLSEEKVAASTSAQETRVKMADISEPDKPKLPTPTSFSPSGSSSTVMMSDFSSDCSESFDRGERANRVYTIQPNGSEPFMAFCYMSRGHGETVIQQRRDGSVNFDQPWEKYENGFGDLQGDFWSGLNKIYSSASQGNSVLHIQSEDWKQNRHFIEYGFYLDGPESNYAIRLIYSSGSSPNPMSNHTGVVFSTMDRDNGGNWASRCPLPLLGGWWFNSCGDTNLNERYLRMRANGRSQRRRGIQWRSGQKEFHFFTFTQISIRPVDPMSPTHPASAPL